MLSDVGRAITHEKALTPLLRLKSVKIEGRGGLVPTLHGVGPVIAAGLLAHIDITRANTAGSIWRFAGLDPTSEWKKGTKRPHNAALKTLCWKLGESFVKISGKEDSVYGKLYKERKAEESAKNERGEFADQAKQKLEKFKIGKTTDAYKAYSVRNATPSRCFSAICTKHGTNIIMARLPPHLMFLLTLGMCIKWRSRSNQKPRGNQKLRMNQR